MFSSLRRVHSVAATLVAVLVAIAIPAASVAADPARRTIKLTGTDAMQFSLRKLEAKPGERLTVALTAQGSMAKAEMAHNWVLLAQGTPVDAFVMAAVMARQNDYIPASKKTQILAATGLAGAGETVTVDFEAPTAPGEYVFVCSFPGHFAGGMKGVLIVR